EASERLLARVSEVDAVCHEEFAYWRKKAQKESNEYVPRYCMTVDFTRFAHIGTGAPPGALDFGAALPHGLVYRPEFLTLEEEAALLREIARLTLQEATYKSYTAKRRVANFGSSYDFDRNKLDP